MHSFLKTYYRHATHPTIASQEPRAGAAPLPLPTPVCELLPQTMRRAGQKAENREGGCTTKGQENTYQSSSSRGTKNNQHRKTREQDPN